VGRRARDRDLARRQVIKERRGRIAFFRFG
jgi:hypothetical protein